MLYQPESFASSSVALISLPDSVTNVALEPPLMVEATLTLSIFSPFQYIEVWMV